MNPKLISGISTAAIVALAILLMSLNIFAYEPPDPPTPEEGVEVNLGDSDFGLGDSPEPASQATSYARSVPRPPLPFRTLPSPAM